jgi:hypothetical protein
MFSTNSKSPKHDTRIREKTNKKNNLQLLFFANRVSHIGREMLCIRDISATVPLESLFEAPDRAKGSAKIFNFYVSTC